MDKLIIKTVPTFDRQAKKLLSEKSQEELFDYLEANPEKGDVIAGTGGVRKLRWATGKNNKGKSGGVRVLYHYSKSVLIILIMLYSKNEVENIPEAEKNELKKLIPQLVRKYKTEE
jgi:hypothetical protein